MEQIVLTAIFVFLVIATGRLVARIFQRRNASGVASRPPADPEVTADLRMQFLSGEFFSDDGGGPAHQETEELAAPGANAAVMDLSTASGVATLIACRDGTVSLYFSNGGGIIGLGGHEAIREPAARFLEAAESSRSCLSPATRFPQPDKQVIFYLVDKSTTFSSGPMSQHKVQSRTHPLFSLDLAAQDLLTKIRKVS